MAIGPLTNIAMAVRMSRDFGKKLKDCYIMGGNVRGKTSLDCLVDEITIDDENNRVS